MRHDHGTQQYTTFEHATRAHAIGLLLDTLRMYWVALPDPVRLRDRTTHHYPVIGTPSTDHIPPTATSAHAHDKHRSVRSGQPARSLVRELRSTGTPGNTAAAGNPLTLPPVSDPATLPEHHRS